MADNVLVEGERDALISLAEAFEFNLEVSERFIKWVQDSLELRERGRRGVDHMIEFAIKLVGHNQISFESRSQTKTRAPLGRTFPRASTQLPEATLERQTQSNRASPGHGVEGSRGAPGSSVLRCVRHTSEVFGWDGTNAG